jgi:acyl transferase domain-containing protein/NADPH:quinone reductase-like Zn-dependent oxidoreductase/acyl carrier protein
MSEPVTNMQAAFEKVIAEKYEPIAIVGVGLRLSGGITSIESFHRMLFEGQDNIVQIPQTRWDNRKYFKTVGDQDNLICTNEGGYLDDIDKFDPAFFLISPKEARYMDPQQRIMLELCWHALENAGLNPVELRGGDGSIYLGTSSLDYAREMVGLSEPQLVSQLGTGTANSAISGRVAYFLGWRGPCLTLDTACSSSLVAMHLAATALRNRETSVALAGGINIVHDPVSHIIFTRANMLSPDGRCKTFDEAADGYGRSEGAVVMVLKRLSDAIADGNRILALIRGTAVGQDGESGGLTVPNGRSQEAVMREAIRRSPLKPSDIGYVEAHGTGTPLGDPIEMHAIHSLFGGRDRPEDTVYVGSSKTNLGHMEAAAGAGGVLKCIAQFVHGVIYPHIHLHKPSSKIDWSSLAVTVPTAPLPWNRPVRRALVNSFGFAGTIACLVLEQPPERRTGQESERNRLPTTEEGPLVATVSAKSPGALLRNLQAHLDLIESSQTLAMPRYAWSAAVGRGHHAYRWAAPARDRAKLIDAMRCALSDREGLMLDVEHNQMFADTDLAFLITGQGAQIAGMGAGLYRRSREFRNAFDQVARHFDALLDVDMRELMFSEGPEAKARLGLTRYTQPALFVFNYAVAQMWIAYGIEPTIFLGHSVGEIVSACLSGLFTLEDAVRMTARRAELMQSVKTSGAMLAVKASREVLAARIEAFDDVGFGGFNGPTQNVLSGDKASIEKIEQLLSQDGIAHRRLDVSHAFHSAHMADAAAEFREFMRTVSFNPLKKSFVSNVTGSIAEYEMVATPEYWARHIVSPVDFDAGMVSLAKRGPHIFLETGPSPHLSALGKGCVDASQHFWVPTVVGTLPEEDDLEQAVVALYNAGLRLDWRVLHASARSEMCELPPYSFDHGAYWLPSAANTASGSNSGHPLLGQLVFHGPEQWRYSTRIASHSPRYLADHVVMGRTIFPGTAYVECVLAAQDAIFGHTSMPMIDLEIHEPLLLADDDTIELSTDVFRETDSAYRIQISSRSQGHSKTHFTCRLEEDAYGFGSFEHAPASDPADASSFDKTRLYDRLASLGLQYGPQFRRVEFLHTQGERSVSGSLSCEDMEPWEILNPGLFDGVLHTLEPLLGQDRTMIPVGWSKLRLWRKPRGRITCTANVQPGCDLLGKELRIDLGIWADGRPVLQADGLCLRELKSRAPAKRDLFHRLVWQEDALDPREISAMPVFVVGCPESLRPLLPLHMVIVETPGEALDNILASSALQHDLRIQLAWFWNAPSISQDADVDDVMAACGAVYEPLLDFIKTLHRRAPALTLKLILVSHGALMTDSEDDRLLDRVPVLIDTQLQATLSGFCAVLNSEFLRIRAKLVDLAMTAGPAERCHALLNELYLGDSRADGVVAYRGGKRLVRRLETARLMETQSNFRLMPSDEGLLSGLRANVVERVAPAGDQIEVRVVAAGLNFKDVINALGLLRKNAEDLGLPHIDMPLGFECAGVVVAVGDDAPFEVGDSVMVSHLGCMQRYVTVSGRAAARVPAGISLEQAAAIPTAFITSYHALYSLAKIDPSDRVLVHAAAGGVGQAALQLCRRIGAEVFATASAAKWEMLRAQGVRHIMDSRSTRFAEEILELTEGHGVTVVLNSLNKDFIAAGLESTAKHGRFIEIGKLGVWSSKQVEAARPDVQYSQFDLSELSESELMEVNKRILDDVVGMLQAGEITPLPITCYPLDKCTEAFGLLARGANVGKIVLTFEEKAAQDVDCHREIRKDGTYLITGGYGALGQKVAEWLARAGARHLALLGRRQPADEVANQLRTRLVGIENLDLLTADVADRRSVERIFDEAASKGRPVRGVIHLAGVIADAPIMEQSWDAFKTVFAPKVAGTWNLWRAAESRGGIDTFIGFSSIASVIGSVSQANYAAANAFIDAMMSRSINGRRMGLALNWGPWADIGMAAELTNQQKKAIERKGISLVTVQQGADAFDFLTKRAQGQFVVGEVNWTEYKSSLPVEDSLYDAVEELRGDSPAANAFDVGRLAALPKEERAQEVQSEVIRILRQILQSGEGDRIPRRATFAELGVDSLVAVELRNMLEKSFGFPLPSSLVFDYPAVPSLVAHLLEQTGSTADRDAGAQENSEVRDHSGITGVVLREKELS